MAVLHQQLEAVFVFNKVLENSRRIESLLNVFFVGLRHMHEESANDHHFLAVEDLSHFVEPLFGFGLVGGTAFGRGSRGLDLLAVAIVVPVKEACALRADISVARVVFNEELQTKQMQHQAGEGEVLHVAQ